VPFVAQKLPVIHNTRPPDFFFRKHPSVIASEAKQSRNWPNINEIAAALRASQ
jgi:hypothetical protein